MQVILLEKVGRLGNIGEEVRVKDGYARNYLLPQKKALRASEENRKYFEAERAKIEALNAEKKAAAEKVGAKLDGLKLVVVRPASQDGKLYGAISTNDIVDIIKDKGVELERKYIQIASIIKRVGDYEIKVNLHPEVVKTLSLSVQNSEQNDEDERKAKSSASAEQNLAGKATRAKKSASTDEEETEE